MFSERPPHFFKKKPITFLHLCWHLVFLGTHLLWHIFTLKRGILFAANQESSNLCDNIMALHSQQDLDI